MKKLILIAVLMSLASMVYAQAFEAGNDNALYHMPKYVNSYTKDYVLTVRLTKDSIMADDTPTVLIPGAGFDTYFIVPEAAELMQAWVVWSDSVLSADTVTNYYEWQVFSNAGAAADTAFYGGGVGYANQPRLGKVDTLTATTTVSKRSFSKGEIGKVRIEDTGTPTSYPAGSFMYLLFRPKSYPVSTDYYTRP